jgi:hypothetical protein
MNSENKRYVVTLQFYVWSDSDTGAILEGKRIAVELDTKFDNKAGMVEVHEQKWGTLSSSRIYPES